MKYEVNSFVLYELEDGFVIQTDNSIVAINEKNMIDLLKYIECENLSIIDQNVFDKFFLCNDEDLQEVIDFLCQNQILQVKIDKKFVFKRVVLISNNSKFTELFTSSLDERFEICVVDIDSYSEFCYKEEDLSIIFMNPFNMKKYNEINSFMESRNLIIKNIIFYNHSIYMSNFYKKEWMNPCYKCFMANLEAQLRGTMFEDTMNFQLLIDLIYEKDSSFSVCAELTKDKYVMVIYSLLYQLEKISNRDADINKIYHIDYNRMSITEDVVFYWEVCDCYE